MNREHIDEKARNIKCVIFDVDGVLTDGTLYYTDTALQIKAFHAHDGVGIQLLLRSGLEVAIITTHQSDLITERMKALNIKHVFQGYHNKKPAYNELLQTLNLTPQQVCYMGDDLPDLPLIRCSGLSITVPTATRLIKQYADWQTTAQAGQGAVREACELIMEAQNTLNPLLQQYLD